MRIIFAGEWSLLSFLVGLRTWSFAPFGMFPRWISHVLIVLDDGRAVEASFSQQRVIAWKWSGLRRGVWGWSIDADRLFTRGEQFAATSKITSLIGKPYDTKGALAYLVDRPEENVAGAFFCFEVLRAVFPGITDKKPQRTVGRQLWRGLRRIAKSKGLTWSRVCFTLPRQ